MKRTTLLANSILGIGIIVVALAIYVHRVPRSPFDTEIDAEPSLTADGEYVARLADCVACHSIPSGEPFAGGLKMGTPFGALYSTNITPDPDNGIGRYTLAEFDNAVRRGVAKDGRRLYPAMPYPSYAKLTDADVRALYGYFMLMVRPVHRANQPPEIGFPFDQRWGLALWNGLFLSTTPYESKKEQGEVWNRGAYIVQGPGHCGSCHTPRSFAFSEKALDERGDKFLAGALLDGWYASNLRGDPALGLGSWTEQDIVQFLKLGRNTHGVVFGSMLNAFNNSTQYMRDADLIAVARYLKSLPDNQNNTPVAYDPMTLQAFEHGDLRAPGAGLYLKQCASCHGLDGKGSVDLLPPLAGSASVLEREPASLLNVVLNGSGRVVADGVPDSYRMPSFRVLLSDEEIADIATFVRISWGNNASRVDASQVRKLRDTTDPSSDHVTILRMR
ncbi:c-type cytochrome [Burkholderia pseudomallei]|uniref:c-type cytochrome n=1 Tax=Burkholderia pseudomallei TaxID=28450 RepID=UPI003F65FF51